VLGKLELTEELAKRFLREGFALRRLWREPYVTDAARSIWRDRIRRGHSDGLTDGPTTRSPPRACPPTPASATSPASPATGRAGPCSTALRSPSWSAAPSCAATRRWHRSPPGSPCASTDPPPRGPRPSRSWVSDDRTVDAADLDDRGRRRSGRPVPLERRRSARWYAGRHAQGAPTPRGRGTPASRQFVAQYARRACGCARRPGIPAASACRKTRR
jgi:hypothetical protein